MMDYKMTPDEKLQRLQDGKDPNWVLRPRRGALSRVFKVLYWVTIPIWYPCAMIIAIVVALALDIGCMFGLIDMG